VDSHLVLVVDLGEDGHWLVDVGNGNASASPLRLFPKPILQGNREGDAAAGDGFEGHAFVVLPLHAGDRPAHNQVIPGADDPSYAEYNAREGGTYRVLMRVPWKARLGHPSAEDAMLPRDQTLELLRAIHPTQWLDSTDGKRLVDLDNGPLGVGKVDAETGEPRYGFNVLFEFCTAPKQFNAQSFSSVSAWHQKDPASPFQRGLVVSRPLKGGGRITVASGVWTGQKDEDRGASHWEFKLYERASATSDRKDSLICGKNAVVEILRDKFGIML
jgi:hypothetical protein